MTAEDRPPDREIPDLEGRIQEAIGMIEGRLADTRPRISPLFLEAVLRVLRGEEPGDVPTAPSPRARTPSDHGWG